MYPRIFDERKKAREILIRTGRGGKFEEGGYVILQIRSQNM